MRLHMLGLPHTRTVAAMSHCAYTGKVRRFAAMMAPLGYEVIHYGVGEPDSPGWSDCVRVMHPDRQQALLGYDPTERSPLFVGRDCQTDSPLYREFNGNLMQHLAKTVQPEDWICAPFGTGHAAALTPAHLAQTVETGIGYYHGMSAYRIYESHAWWHWHLGRDQRAAWLSEFVIPNYFDVEEWPLRLARAAERQYALYLGRIQADKGLDVIWQLAKARPDIDFVVCGQGDATPWLLPNLRYLPPVHGAERAALMHGAFVVLAPSQYVEPFGGVAVEAMLTGTPVLTSAHGAYSETNPIAEYRCRTAGQWLAGLEAVLDDDPVAVQRYARGRFGLEAVGPLYHAVFQQLPALARDGWAAGLSNPPQE